MYSFTRLMIFDFQTINKHHNYTQRLGFNPIRLFKENILCIWNNNEAKHRTLWSGYYNGIFRSRYVDKGYYW